MDYRRPPRRSNIQAKIEKQVAVRHEWDDECSLGKDCNFTDRLGAKETMPIQRDKLQYI